MTSDLAGTGPLLPTGYLAFQQPPNRTSPQPILQAPRARPRQSFTPTYRAPETLRDASEPPFKKRKLEDHARTGFGSPWREISGPTEIKHAASNKRTVPGSGASCLLGPDSKSNIKGKEQKSRQPTLCPKRSGKSSYAGGIQHGHSLAIERATARDVVEVKPYAPETPTFAPLIHRTESADFFPWTGHHPEDVLNELTTKQGFYDKAQGSQNESNTARPSVWSSLKHKSGLQILSSLFVSALDQRQLHGTTTANSTFKPPPRVTLTDTKREAWLRDLANPSTPLRRLSRTIPHGIRGRILLDHCLSKNIPTSRALWLAKCVGANEIRAFRRKGAGGVFTVGGEAKWIRDWTTNVEQFLESIFSACGSSGWRANINYGLRLVSHLYSEHLLDKDHYLDWLTNSLHGSDLEDSSIWIFVIQIYQKDILQQRQRGRRFAEAVLGHLHEALLPVNRGSYNAVLRQLSGICKAIMMFAPTCFILPVSWHRHEGNIRSCVDRHDEDMRSCFDALCRRNRTLQIRSLEQCRQVGKSDRQQIIVLLDGLFIEQNFRTVAGSCLRVTSNSDVLVKTCIEWATSIYRHGDSRLYASARLLRIWNRHGVEIQRPILDFLASSPNPAGLHKKNIYRLLAELARSQHFSVGQYLQWLIARGALHQHHELEQEGPCDTHLLLQLPLQGLPSHVINLRHMLLNSLGLSAEEETRVVDAIKGKIASQVPELFLSLDGSYSIDLDYTLLSQNVKSAVARWIRQHLISRLQVYNECDTSDEDFDRQIPTSSRHSSNFMTLEQFQLVRHILEELEDFSILADVLFIVSSGGQGLILTDVTDTVNHYFDIFDAIGAADCLFRSLYQQVRDSCGQELPDKDFLESLMDLACHLSDVDEEVRNLQKEMSAHVSRHSAAAYSPISDNMVEAVQFTTEPTFADEMDQMLASGTSMDKQTLTRVFRTIIDHLETSDRKSTHLTTRFAQLLARLRKFAPKTFNALLRGWLQELPISNPRKEISKITPPLICARVVSLDVVLNNTTLLLSHNGNRDAQATLALDLLAIVTEARSGRMPVVEYRSYRLPNQIKRLLRTSPASVMSIVSVALDACTATNIPLRTRARTQLNSLAVRNLIQILVIMQSRSAIDSRSSFSTNGLQKAFGAGLDCDELGAPPHFGLRIRISKLLETLNDLNVPLAQLELRAILEVSDSGGNAANAIAEAFLDFPKNPTTHYIDLRACLVSELSVSQAASIRERAETEILAWVVRNIAFGSKEGLTAAIEAWVSIVEAAAFSVRTETSPLIHQISDYLLAIGAMPPEDKDRLDRGIDTNDVFHFISVLLRILTIHQSTFQHQKNSQSTLLQVLVSLGLLLIHPLLHSNPTLAGFVFDTLNLFSDFATHETRSRCISTLREHPGARDPRLQFIFGYSEIVDGEWLQVSIQSSSIGDSKIEGATTPYPLRRWEMVQDATPITTENDTSLSLIFFGARKSVL